MFLLFACKENKPSEASFKLKAGGLLLIEGSFNDSLPANIWRYYDSDKNLLVKKAYYPPDKTGKVLSDIFFYDSKRLVYFKNRFGKTESPESKNWGETLVKEYCQGCHTNQEEMNGPALYEMRNLSQENFSRKITQFHPSNSNQAINYNFLTLEDLKQIKRFIDNELVKSE
ncbi:hypothetical protein F0P94_03010 [Adhaeribacter soli]|uniref:Cytochrome c domain-containing protein n=1 Tax=Adhaeribacter soli TaxID=2607655 RepID=A0A5N1J578_9BACT|nr:hypothetical protein F0P94_03010 [Adhaeribacter soli]